MSNSNNIEIPVRMGSNCFKISNDDINFAADSDKVLTCKQLIDIVLARCKIHGSDALAKTYSVFERVNGVERMLGRNVDVARVWREWRRDESQLEFVVRKLNPIEKRVLRKCANKMRVESFNRKCFSKLHKLNEQSKTPIHDYETIEQEAEQVELASAADKRAKYMKKIIKNELILQKQAAKLLALEQSIYARVLDVENRMAEVCEKQSQPEEQQAPIPVETRKSDAIKTSKMCQFHKSKLEDNFKALKLNQNANLLKLLCAKLKPTGRSLSREVNSRTHLISSEINSCGNSSDEYDSATKTYSRTSSTSTLESLV
jgi:hypothetical protein